MSFSVGRRRHTTRKLRVCGRNELTQEINGSVINQSGSSNVHPPLVAELVSSVAGQDARLFLLILFIWVSCVLLEILTDPNFPDDIPVSLDRVSRH